MCIFFFIGGGVLLSMSLSQVQIRVTYSDVGELANLTNAERALVMQNKSATLATFMPTSDSRSVLSSQLQPPPAPLLANVQHCFLADRSSHAYAYCIHINVCDSAMLSLPEEEACINYLQLSRAYHCRW
jgi:hypothetical protein